MTLVVVAHRLSTVEACDYVYWIEGGEIHMEGTPAGVLPAYGAYLIQKKEGGIPPKRSSAHEWVFRY